MNTKLAFYPAVIVACLLGLIALLLVWLRLSISIESAPSETSSMPSTSPESQTPQVMNASPTAPRLTEQSERETPSESRSAPGYLEVQQGALRVSNRTDRPLRLALLARRSGKAISGKPTYSTPVHWDFAPEEGMSKGLVLSLPDGNSKLKTGDVLVAFAQDGSRSYWGPYVIGETPLPVWNNQTNEWQLILR